MERRRQIFEESLGMSMQRHGAPDGYAFDRVVPDDSDEARAIQRDATRNEVVGVAYLDHGHVRTGFFAVYKRLQQ